MSMLPELLARLAAHPMARRAASLGPAALAPGPLEIGQLAAPALKASSMQGDFGRTDALLGKQSAGATPNAYVGRAFDTNRYYPGLGDKMAPMMPQGPPASAAWSQQPMGTINSHPVMQQPIAAPGPSATAGMGFNPYPGMPAQSNPTAPPVGDPRMTTGGPDLINKMLAYFQKKDMTQ